MYESVGRIGRDKNGCPQSLRTLPKQRVVTIGITNRAHLDHYLGKLPSGRLSNVASQPTVNIKFNRAFYLAKLIGGQI